MAHPFVMIARAARPDRPQSLGAFASSWRPAAIIIARRRRRRPVRRGADAAGRTSCDGAGLQVRRLRALAARRNTPGAVSRFHDEGQLQTCVRGDA